MIFLGIDPGLDGCVAAIVGPGVSFHDTPTLSYKSGKSLKRHIDPAGCAEILRKFLPDRVSGEVIVFIEKVNAMPYRKRNERGEEEVQSMGVTSAFNFGWGLGVWEGVCAALALPYEMVAPVTWKKAIMFDMGKEKDASRQKARQLYPHIAGHLDLKKHHNRADALLIARFAQMRHRPVEVPDAPSTLFA